MKVVLFVMLGLCVASQAFILNDGMQSLYMMNLMSGRNPLDFQGLFGGGAAPQTRTGQTGQQGQQGAQGQGQAGSPFNNIFGLSMLAEGGFL